MKSTSLISLSVFLILLITQTACNNEHQYDINTTDKYEKSKVSLTETEQKYPLKFLSVRGQKKKNLFGQIVVKGTIYNNAKMVSYKDVDVKLSFYSKTGALLEEDNNVVYETISPGGSKTFKSKFFTPKGTDSVAFKIERAKY
ncbi:MAG: hypothetical protein ABIY51_10135 [Ferruginibacter sp.]